MKSLEEIKKEILIYGHKSINKEILRKKCERIDRKTNFNAYKKEGLVDFLIEKKGFEIFNDVKISNKNIQHSFEVTNPDMVMLHRKMGKVKSVNVFAGKEIAEIDDYYFSELDKIYDFLKDNCGYQYMYLYCNAEEKLKDLLEPIRNIYDFECEKIEKIDDDDYKYSAYVKIKNNPSKK